MVDSSESSLDDAFERWSSGVRGAPEQVIERVYGELRRLAAGYFRRERRGHTLEPTALVHEAYLQLFGATSVRWRNRAHFLGVAARLMRRILVDHARHRDAKKRGGGMRRLSLSALDDLSPGPPPELLALDDALRGLATFDPRKARVVEARYFGGLSVEEVGEYLGVSRATVIRDWRQAKAWLRAELREPDPEDS